MKINSESNPFRRGAALIVCALSILLSACASSNDDAESYSTLELPLETTISGTTYRLVGSFEVLGPDIVTLDASEGIEAVTASLQPGSYSVSLMPGWQLQKDEAGVFEDVSAELVSSNPQMVDIFESQSAVLTFDFAVGPNLVSFGDNAALNIEISVDDGADVEAMFSICGEGTHCIASTFFVDAFFDPASDLSGAEIPYAASFDVLFNNFPGSFFSEYTVSNAELQFDLTGLSLTPDEQLFFDNLAAGFGPPATQLVTVAPNDVQWFWNSFDGQQQFEAFNQLPTSTDAMGSSMLIESLGSVNSARWCDFSSVIGCLDSFPPPGNIVAVRIND